MYSSRPTCFDREQDLLSSEKFKLNLESYFRLVFQELIRSQRPEPGQDLSPRRYISAFTFWQYSKLPKLISDRLFSVFARDQRWSCTDFISCFYSFLTKSEQEMMDLIFKMADFRGHNSIYLQDLKSLIQYCLVVVNKSGFLLKVKPGFYEALSRISQMEVKYKLQPLQFRALMEKTGLHTSIIALLQTQLNIVQKVQGYYGLDLLLEATFANLSSSKLLTQIKECVTQEDSEVAQEQENQPSKTICEGTMYRMIEGKGIKPYYYKLINSELFSFREKEDREPKKVVYYGHSSYVLAQRTELKTIKNKRQIYCLEAASSDKRTQYFLTNVEDFLKWKTALLSVMRLPGFFNEDFQLFEEIGQGEFGTVSKATNLKSGESVAIKAINKLKLSHSSSRLLREEIEIHELCNHPNLVKLHNVYEDDQNVYLEMEQVKGGSLSQYISRRGPVSNWFIIGVLHQVAKALRFLKSLNIMHRDVKSQNILLTGKFIRFQDLVTEAEYEIPEVKLADYGLSTIIQSNEKLSLLCGTCAYMAPEVFVSSTYDYAADVYSLGVVAYELCSRRLPFISSSPDKFKRKLLRQDPNYDFESFKLLPRQLRSLIQRMLAKSPQRRPSLERIIEPGVFLFPESLDDENNSTD